jgi:lipoprotein-anchoring transpeptidase ErfK/SrfK
MTAGQNAGDGRQNRGFLIPRRLAIGGVVVGLAAVLLFGAAYAYARSQDDVIAHGIHVGAIDLGGLSAPAARARLDHAFAPLERPLVLRYPRGRLVVTARAAKVEVEVDALVARALDLSRRSWFLPRAWRELSGEGAGANLRPKVDYSRSAVERIIRLLQRRIDRRPRNAVLVPSFDRLIVKRDRPGVAFAVGPLRRALERTLVSARAPRILEVTIRHPRPRVSVSLLRRRYPSFVTIDRAAFRLRLFIHLRFARSYPIAVGQQGLQTPAGIYHIQNKVINPSWQVPFSSWTGSLAGQVIPPGADDPLKARWLGIFNGAGMHGTDETWSIGHAVSHGCVRMTIPDVIDLYNRVKVGTPVYIGD